MRKPTHIEVREGRSGLSEPSNYIAVPFYFKPVLKSLPEKKPSILQRVLEKIEEVKIEHSWRQVEKQIQKVLRRLSNQELIDLPDMFYFHQARDQWMIKPDLDTKLSRKIAPLVTDSGTVPASTQLAMKDVYLEEMQKRSLI